MPRRSNISIVLASYNGELFLREQLDSLAVQTLLPYELIVQDDQSTDATMQILADFAEIAPFPVSIQRNERNLGSTANFDIACGRCTGAYVAFCDQDDVWRANKLERFAALFNAKPQLGMVFSNAERVTEHLKTLPITLWDSLRLPKNLPAIMRSSGAGAFILSRPVVTGATMVVSRKALELARPFPTGPINWIHDRWTSAVISLVFEVEAIEDRLILYRQHAGQQIGADVQSPSAISSRFLRKDHLIQQSLDEVSALANHIFAKDLDIPPELRKLLHDRRTHFEARLRLREARLRRLPTIFRELRNGGYNRHSSGILSAMKDFVL